MGSTLAAVITAFETHAGASAANIAQFIVSFLAALFIAWTAYQFLGYYRAWAAGNSSFFDMALYLVRNMILLVIVVSFILQ
jgi:integrating conjugative element protein (TIGR03758 family)